MTTNEKADAVPPIKLSELFTIPSVGMHTGMLFIPTNGRYELTFKEQSKQLDLEAWQAIFFDIEVELFPSFSVTRIG